MKTKHHVNWRAYPSLLLSGCLGLGILAASTMPAAKLSAWAAAAGTTGVLTVASCILEDSRRPTPWKLIGTISLFLLGMCTGAICYKMRHTPPEHHLLAITGRTPNGLLNGSPSVRGEIVSFPVSTSRYIRFTLEADSIRLASASVPVAGKLQVTLWKPHESDGFSYPTLLYRQDLLIHAGIREVALPGNPAAFDYKSYLARRGIHFTLSVSHPSQITVLETRVPPAAGFLTVIRTYVSDSIMTHVPGRSSRAVLMALLLGDRSGLDPVVTQAFQQTGLMHLLAISGLHVMIIGLVFYNLLLPFLTRVRFSWTAMEWSRSGVTLTVLLIYCLIAGAPASVVRALVMTALVLGGVLAQRLYHPLNALGAAAIVLLTANPDQLFDAGFQLSFAAVGGILTITPVLNRSTPTRFDHQWLLYYLKNTLFASVAATLATMPVTLFHFGQAAFGGLLLNLLAIPVTALILSGAVTTVLFHGGAPLISEAVGLTTDRAISALLQIASLGDRVLHWTLLQESVRNPTVVVGLVSGLLIIVHWHRPRLRWRCTILSLLFFGIHLWVETARSMKDQNLEVIFFDVGQGDAALVELPNNRCFLVDGGNRSSYGDEGSRTILPHLERYHVEKLDAVVVSHAHRDHMGGLLTVLREVPVGRVIYNGQEYSSRLFEQMKQLTDSLRVDFQAVTAGDTIDFDPTVRMQVLAPFTRPAETADPNEASLVLRLIYKDISFLFTGDIERQTERLLVKKLARFLPADVVKVPHHGSKTSSSLEFVRRVTALPEDKHTAIISAGRNNRFGLPDEHIVERWRLRGARVRSTRRGAVWLQTDGHRLVHVPWR